MQERRKFPRRAANGERANLLAAVPVRVLDISVAGVLLHTARPIDVGTSGSLRLSLGGTTFEADVRVERASQESSSAAGCRIGASFLAVSPEHRQLIERLMVQ